MKKLISLSLALVFSALSPGGVRSEETAYKLELKTDTYCYATPDVYTRPLTLLPRQEVNVIGGDNGWALIDSYLGEIWVQEQKQEYYMKYVFDTYGADRELTAENFLPQTVTVYDVKDGWLRIDPTAEVWVKPGLLKDKIVFDGQSWNQYTDDKIYTQKTHSACELYAAASAMNSIKRGYTDHPLQLIDKVERAANPYEGFNENYGMYAQPLADFINDSYGDDFSAFNATGISVNNFKEILAANGRIVVWLNTGKGVYSTAGGVRVLLSSHTIAVVGIDDKNVYITDSSAKAGVRPMSRSSFENAFVKYYPDKNQCVVLTARENGDRMSEYLNSLGNP